MNTAMLPGKSCQLRLTMLVVYLAKEALNKLLYVSPAKAGVQLKQDIAGFRHRLTTAWACFKRRRNDLIRGSLIRNSPGKLQRDGAGEHDFEIVEREIGPVIGIEETAPIWQMAKVMGRDFGRLMDHIKSQNGKHADAPYIHYVDIDWKKQLNKGMRAR
jgi:hypothetical protein